MLHRYFVLIFSNPLVLHFLGMFYSRIEGIVSLCFVFIT